jgi:DNA-binding NtrC family response regulator
MRRRVLIIDDDPTIRTSLREALAEAGVEVAVAEDGSSALPLLGQFNPDLVLCDVRMTDMGGLEVLRTLKARAPDVDVILMTAFDDMSTIASAMQGGAVDFLVKPIGLDQLLTVTERVFQDQQERVVNRNARGSRDVQASEQTGLVGRDPRMIEVFKLIGQAAASFATVLIRGESGTGKELVARAIHRHSLHAAEPFIPVNCAALPSTLLETELFGHVRGAFTGAMEARRGRFAAAGRGTIFLDEIGDTSLELQTRLLRILQDGEYQPVGSERSERSAARVIAATHQPLEAMISARQFREDLYYRLRVVEIVIPPLRERPGDIPAIAEHLLRAAAASLGHEVPLLARDALDRLLGHSWPGNVRELENCLKRAAVIAAGGVIRGEHLTFGFPRTSQESELSSLEDVEREQVRRVLEATRGHKGRAAEILGVSRPRLRRLLDKYGLE